MLVTRLDVREMDSIESAVRLGLKTFGQIDVLVNNAGYGGYTLFEQASDEAIRAMYDTNVFGVMNVSRAVLPRCRPSRSDPRAKNSRGIRPGWQGRSTQT